MSVSESHLLETGAPPNEKRRALSRGACKKILFISNTNEYGGAEKHLLELIRRLRGPGVQLCILCFEKDFFSERLGPDHDVEVTICMKAPQSLWDWVRHFRAVQPDVVVFVYGWFWAIPCSALVGAWLAGVRRRLAIQHLMTPPWPVPSEVWAAVKQRRSMRSRLRRLLGRDPWRELPWMANLALCVTASLSSPAQLRRSAYFCNTIICVSNALRDSLVKNFKFPARKVKTIHNGISLTEFVPSANRGSQIRDKLGIGRDEFILVCVARLSEQKRIDILLQALAHVLREGVRCKCIIVGDGPLKRQLFEQVRAMGLSGYVFFEGFHEDVRLYLQAGSAFILTSDSEGLPLSILEAMACGLPSIVTDVGGNAEIIAHRVHGLIVPRGSVDAIVDGISYLAKHPQERAEMARMARKRVCEAFDIENAMGEIRRLILS